MWFVVSKKELNKELEKIQSDFLNRDNKIETLREKLEAVSLRLATMEGAYNLLSQYQSSSSLSKVSGTIETKLIQRIRQNKKSIIISEIMKLLESYSTPEIYDRIVSERKLCSKASFYRYIKSLEQQKLVNNTYN